MALYLSHLSLLKLPYYWDEAGYYIPAAYDLYRTGALIPYSTLTNAHPPLPALYLALWWKLSGFNPATTRIAVLLVASAALLAVYRLALRITGRSSIAASTTLLTALYPIWFAQSTLAHADIFAAALTLWGLSFYLPADEAARPAPAALCFALAALAKETAIAIPLALATYELWQALRDRSANRYSWHRAAWLLASLVPLCLWYVYHWRRTGFVFGNPEYLRYNAQSTLSPLRILLALGHRVLHLTAHMNLFVPGLCALASLLLSPRPLPDGSPRPPLLARVRAPLAWIFAVNLVFYSVVGGALLTRYLLPLYPLVLLACVAAFWRRVPAWGAMVALAAAAFCLGLFINPPYRFAPEDNLNYADSIRLQQQAIHQLTVLYPRQTVLTAWPATDELTKPELGYVRGPVPVITVDNFSQAEIERAATLRGYSTALVFSTKYDPPHPGWHLGNESLDQRYFAFHHDLTAAQIATLLGGTIAWQADKNGQWAAVLHFGRAQ